jgi:TPR repeat protein
MGIMYAQGLGTPVDRAKAYAWFSLAASQGNGVARMAGNDLMTRMSWEELTRAQALSVDLFKEVENNQEQRHGQDR